MALKHSVTQWPALTRQVGIDRFRDSMAVITNNFVTLQAIFKSKGLCQQFLLFILTEV